jgi:hypothetical protein
MLRIKKRETFETLSISEFDTPEVDSSSIA